MGPAFQYITTKADLILAMAQCRRAHAVALDTEFARFDTYYPIVGLIQIFDGKSCFLIDPITIQDFSSLADLLGDKNVIKVLHACSEDLEVLHNCVCGLPEPLFDSQIAAALLGVGFSISYQKLIKHYLNILVPKEETCSDWLQRPLTNSQLNYATLDVIYLLDVYQQQRKLLHRQDREAWLEQECRMLTQDIATQIAPEEFYKKTKNIWRLDRRQLFLYQSLCAWREEAARYQNIPRNWVLDEKTLFIIAANTLQDKKAFRDKTNITHRQLRLYGDVILALIKKANQVPLEELPDRIDRPFTHVDTKALKSLERLVQEKANEMNVVPEILVKRRSLKQLMGSDDGSGNYKLPDSLLGWREDAIGQILLRKISQHRVSQKELQV